MKLNQYLAEETSKHVEIVGFSTAQINVMGSRIVWLMLFVVVNVV